MSKPLVRRVARYGLGLIVVALAWFFFAPTQLGGKDTYVITDGTSMLPTIHGGGLVIARQEGSYHAGDIVGYHDAQLGGTVILHRIIKVDDGHYTFKGDNNKYADLFPPTKDKLVGRRWLYWPSGGRFLMNLRTPIVGAIVLGAFATWAFWDLGAPRKVNRRRRNHHRTA